MSNSPQNNKDKSKGNLHDYARYSSIAIQMLVIITAGVWGGVQLDKLLNLKFPLLTILLSFASVGIAIYISIKDFINTDKKK
ncbi:MAG: AtpZ/AtpI family protein [Bacteroidota bacterium]